MMFPASTSAGRAHQCTWLRDVPSRTRVREHVVAGHICGDRLVQRALPSGARGCQTRTRLSLHHSRTSQMLGQPPQVATRSHLWSSCRVSRMCSASLDRNGSASSKYCLVLKGLLLRYATAYHLSASHCSMPTRIQPRGA